MKRLRPIAAVLGTLAAGALAGYVVMAFLSPLLPGPVQPGDRHELTYTREYLLAILERDAATVNQLSMPRNAVDRASLRKTFEQALELEPVTLTFLGGSANQTMGAYVYVLGVKTPESTFHLVPFSMTTIQSKVADLRGGSTGMGG